MHTETFKIQSHGTSAIGVEEPKRNHKLLWFHPVNILWWKLFYLPSLITWAHRSLLIVEISPLHVTVPKFLDTVQQSQADLAGASQCKCSSRDISRRIIQNLNVLCFMAFHSVNYLPGFVFKLLGMNRLAVPCFIPQCFDSTAFICRCLPFEAKL